MADFSHNISSNNPDFSRASRGRSADQSISGAVNNLTKGVGIGINAVDQHFQKEVRDQADSSVQQLFDEFGAKSAQDVHGTDVSNPAQPLPVEVQQGGEHIEKLAKAHQQGNLDSRHFYARLSSITRQLRARYPSYREFVDQAVSKSLGTPGHKPLIDALQRAAGEEKKAADKATTRYENFIASKGSVIGRIPNWRNMPEGQLRALVADMEGREAALEAEAKAHKNRASIVTAGETQDKARVRQVEQSFTKTARQINANLIQDVFTGVWGSDKQSILKTFQQYQQSDGRIDEKELQGILGQMGELEARVLSTWDSRVFSPGDDGLTLAGDLDPDFVNKHKEELQAQFNVIRNYIKDKDYGALASYARWFENMDNKAKADILTSDFGPSALFYKNVGGLIPEPILQNFLNLKTSFGRDITSKFEQVAEQLILDPQKPHNIGSTITNLLEKADMTAEQRNELGAGIAKSVIKYLNAADTHDPEQLQYNKKILKRIFGDPSWMVNHYDEANRKQFIDALMQPGVKDKMMANSEFMGLYENFLLRTFPPVFIADLGTIRNGTVATEVGKVVWDDGKFVRQDNPNANSDLNQLEKREIDTSIRTINKYIEFMSTFSENHVQAFAALMKSYVEGENQGGFMTQLGVAVREAIAEPEEKEQKKEGDGFIPGGAVTQ